MLNFAQTTLELRHYFALHEQELIQLFQQIGNITIGEKVAEIEAIPGAVDFFATIFNVLMDKSYWAQLFTTMHRAQGRNWVLETGGMDPIIQCAVQYFGYKKKIRETGKDSPADAHDINKSYYFHVVDYEWSNQALPTTNWPSQLKTETFFGSHEIALFYGMSKESLRQTKSKYETICSSVIKTKNSSAVFHIYDGIYVEPVFIFNNNGHTTLLHTGSYTHTATQEIINASKLSTVSSPNIPMIHNGDCSVYTRTNLNLIAALAKQEHSILQILIKLSKNEINLISYFLKPIDIHLITQPQPSSLCIARMLAFVSTTLRSVGLEKGLVDYFREYDIDEENGLFSMKAIRPKKLLTDYDKQQAVRQSNMTQAKFKGLNGSYQESSNSMMTTLRGDTELIAKKTGRWVSPGLRDTNQYCPNPYNEGRDYFKFAAVPIIHPYNLSLSTLIQRVSLMRYQDQDTPDGYRVQHFLSTQTLNENLYLDTSLLSELHCLNAENIPETGFTMDDLETNTLQVINRTMGIATYDPETEEITPTPCILLSHGELWLVEGKIRIKIEATSEEENQILKTLAAKCTEHDITHPQSLNSTERQLLASIAGLQINTPTVKPHYALQPDNGEGCRYNDVVTIRLYQGSNAQGKKIYDGEQNVIVHDYSVSPSDQEIAELAALLKETVETKPHDDLFLTSYVVSKKEKVILVTHHCLLTSKHMDALQIALSGCFSLSYEEIPSFENPSFALSQAMQSACYIRVNNKDPVIAGLYYFDSKKSNPEEKCIKLDLTPEQLKIYDNGHYGYILFPDDLVAIRKATGHTHPIKRITIDTLKENGILKAAIDAFNENYHGPALELEWNEEEDRIDDLSSSIVSSPMSSESSEYSETEEDSSRAISTSSSAMSPNAMDNPTERENVGSGPLQTNYNLTIQYDYTNRYHFYKARVTIDNHTLYGDAAKRAILNKFKSQLEVVTSQSELDQLIQTLMDSDEYKILKTSQGIVTELSQFLPERLRLKTDSVQAFEAMCEEMRSHLATTCTN